MLECTQKARMRRKRRAARQHQQMNEIAARKARDAAAAHEDRAAYWAGEVRRLDAVLFGAVKGYERAAQNAAAAAGLARPMDSLALIEAAA